MNFTRRDKTILTAFAALIVIGCYAYARKELAPKPRPRAVAASAGDAAAQGTNARSSAVSQPESVEIPYRPYGEYEVIPERNLFRRSQKKPVTQTKRPSLPPAPNPNPLPAPADTGQEAEPEVTVVVTGCMSVGDTKVALVENLETKETKFVRPGQEAFGYRLGEINEEGAVLRKDGKEQFLSLGEGKPTETPAPKKDDKQDAETSKDSSDKKPPPSPPTPTPSAGSPSGSPGGIDFRKMTPEQRDEFRRRWEDRRRSSLSSSSHRH